MARQLLKHGAKIEEGSDSSPLQIAVIHGHACIVKLLREASANANAQHRSSEYLVTRAFNGEYVQYGSALRVVCIEGHRGVVEFLINEGAGLVPDAGDCVENALWVAASFCHESVDWCKLAL